MNEWIKAGLCPFCMGQGWVTMLCPEEHSEPCDACVGTGDINEMWAHQAEELNIAADQRRKARGI